MKKIMNNTNEEITMELICADAMNKKIYVTSGTMTRSLVFGSEAASLINEFRALYPTFKLEENNGFFLSKFRILPL